MAKVQSAAHSLTLRKSIKKIKKITDKPVILDIGANNGRLAIKYLNKFPKAKYYAVEPSKMNRRIFLKRTKDYPNIVLMPFGVANNSGTVNLTEIDNVDMGHISSLFPSHVESHANGKTITTYPVNVMTIQEIIDKIDSATIDLLKINCEGAEYLMFDGNTEWLNRIKIIVIQLHITAPFYTIEYDYKRNAIYSLLYKNNFEFKVGDIVHKKGLKCLNQLWVKNE